MSDLVIAPLGLTGDARLLEPTGETGTLPSRALATQSPLLMLDEPPRRSAYAPGRMPGRLGSLAAEVMAILLTTHQPEHAYHPPPTRRSSCARPTTCASAQRPSCSPMKRSASCTACRHARSPSGAGADRRRALTAVYELVSPAVVVTVGRRARHLPTSPARLRGLRPGVGGVLRALSGWRWIATGETPPWHLPGQRLSEACHEPGTRAGGRLRADRGGRDTTS